jgi:hypothetical protein
VPIRNSGLVEFSAACKARSHFAQDIYGLKRLWECSVRGEKKFLEGPAAEAAFMIRAYSAG